ncbi:MAG: DNA polymerase III subunit beta [Gomphosphaeria aponina SAG 52.96 = DSM 107014]|uniref:Beta sliding clamp n=1 Tax=Gomphosphaeria aponina SAG 52.96 = DSM 107014 TaxID=1521640 RepID=A0A941GPM9_9CHRO|nr:DNA polymerase III subunit beta [Gomphosphaeria aponina SAG 52.96 = DSM 107014]
MKFNCSKTDLNINLSRVSRVVPSRPTHPVLGNVLLVADAEKGRVSLTAFDLSLGIRTSFHASVIEGGMITLPAKLLGDIVSRLPEGEITIAYEDNSGEDNALTTLTSASGRFQIRAMSAEEFPPLPVVENGSLVMLPKSALTEGLRGAAFAASTDETKQVLTGVHLICSHYSLEFAATDGHRLAMVETALDEDSVTSSELEDFEVTIPARALRELEKMLSMAQDTELVGLNFDEGQMVFELGDQILTCRKLEGVYPDYRKLIPTEFTRTATLERKRLLSGLELVAVLADQKNNLVKFTINGEESEVSLSVEAADVGSAKESLPGQITGLDLEIGFNVKYFMEGLKTISAAEIKMHLNECNQPVILTPMSGVKVTYLLMPVQLRN